MKSEHTEIIQKAFTMQSRHFETHRANFMQKGFLDHVVSEVQPKKTDHVLEVAAGTCICGRAFAPFVHEVICLDVTPAMLAVGKMQAEKQAYNNMMFVTGDAEELPFLDYSFDVVISRLAFHHFSNTELPFSEMARVLKKGGKLILIDMEAADEKFRMVQTEIERLRDPSHIQNLSKSEMLHLFSKHNFEVEQCSTATIPKDLLEWLDFTKTPETVQQEIIRRFQAELDGKAKTGFCPYWKNGRICFNHKWITIVGRK